MMRDGAASQESELCLSVPDTVENDNVRSLQVVDEQDAITESRSTEEKHFRQSCIQYNRILGFSQWY
jgi:hypothetical protein